MNREWRSRLLWISVAVVLLIVYAVIAGGLLVLAEMGRRDTREIGLGELVESVESVVKMPAKAQTKTVGGVRSPAAAPPEDSPEYVVYEYFQAIEMCDVDRLFSLGSKVMMDELMRERKTQSAEEFKAKWARELDEIVRDKERVYGKGWSKAITARTVVRDGDLWARVQVTSNITGESVNVFVFKENGDWKVQTWLFD